MTSGIRKRSLANAVGYVLCILAYTYGAEPAAPEIAKLMYRGASLFRHLEPSGVLGFYTRNWFLFNLISGIACGCAVYSVWRRTVTMLVWIPPAAILCQKIASHPHSVMESNASGVRYFLSAGCAEVAPQSFFISPRCWDQVRYSLPLYAAVGFSVGALLAMLYWQRRGSKGSYHDVLAE
jgi:hypothetical protein